VDTLLGCVSRYGEVQLDPTATWMSNGPEWSLLKKSAMGLGFSELRVQVQSEVYPGPTATMLTGDSSFSWESAVENLSGIVFSSATVTEQITDWAWHGIAKRDGWWY